MKKKIEEIIKNAILSLQKEGGVGDFKEIEVNYAVNDKFGEYATNIAMKVIKSANKSPMEVAEEIRKKIVSDDFEKIEVSAPGYINFYLSQKYLQSVVEKINSEKENFGKSEIGQGLKVNNEFISANPTGPLTVGNGRGGFHGSAIGRILEKCGFEKVNEYYINDGGEQVLKLGHSVKRDAEACYQGEYIDELNKKFGKDESIQEIGEKAADEIMEKIIKNIIEGKMKIHFDTWISEREDINKKGETEKAIEILKEKKLTYEKEGALWFKSTSFGDDKDRVLIKSDGKRAYLASDCGYTLNKIKRGFSQAIIILGADHHGYISRIKAIFKALEFPGELKIIITQLVRVVKDGKEARMSKRTGNVIYLEDLIDTVGHDVANFFFLMYSPDSHMVFDLKLAEDRSQKNPVFYVQYAHARIASILRKAQEKNLDFAEADLTKINQKKELNLIQELDKFPDLVKEIGETLEVHKLPHYAIKLADKFHSFYNDLKVIDETDLEISKARLKLANAVKIVLAETLRLIGVEAPERM
jgi:arginyl-tRNA synthetase